MPKLSDEQTAQRRTRILDAAERCFARDGFHGATMQAICREAGISAGALYLYFASKEALIEGITARDRDDILAQFAAASGEGDFINPIGDLLRTCVFGQSPEKATLCIEIGAEATRNPAIAETMSRFDAEIRASIHHLLSQAKAAGKIDPQAPLEDIVIAMALIGDGLFWRRAVDPTFDPARALPQIMSMVAALVRPQAPVHPEAAR